MWQEGRAATETTSAPAATPVATTGAAPSPAVDTGPGLIQDVKDTSPGYVGCFPGLLPVTFWLCRLADRGRLRIHGRMFPSLKPCLRS